MRLFARIVMVVAVIVGIVCFLGAWRVWHALPMTRGTVQVTGVGAPIEVLRDKYGIPHVRARSEDDAYFALGYVHAQDRLWQMEFQRRLARGKLAELLGPEALPVDRLFRTLGFGRLASGIWANVSPQVRSLVESYVRGVNAVIAQQQGAKLPIEFTLLGARPEPWLAEDCFVWAKVISFQLDTNYRDELLRARVLSRVGEPGAAALLPPSTAGGPLIVPEGLPGIAAPGTLPLRTPAGVGSREWKSDVVALAARIAERALLVPSVPRFVPDPGGSNNWVVSGARSVTGKPLLANDPHLGAGVPSIWYLVHLQGGALNAIGASLPGTPAIPIGHNERVAWGVTALMADVQDFYVEHINAKNEAEFQGAWEPMRLFHETIRVKGTPDVPMVVRVTRHGPLLSDVLPGTSGALALRWTALDPDDAMVDGQHALANARNWEEFTVAVSRLHSPMLNFVYADVDGNIGYFAPGALPIRRRHDGTVPVPGWTGEFEWDGYVPADQLPRLFNPTRGFIASANNPALPDEYPYLISTSYEPSYRAARITELIEASPRLSVDAMAKMQADLRTPQVKVLLPWMRRIRPVDDESRAAVDRLRGWDGELKGDSSNAALFMAWVDALTASLFADELGPELWLEWAQWPHWRAKALDHLVATQDDLWCDDVRTVARETCEEVLGTSLRLALDGLESRQGKESTRWRWDSDNRIVFAHAPFEAVALLRPLFSRRVAAGGNATTINPVMWTPLRPTISSYRQIVDLADWDRSRFVQPMGQSGQVLSRHYTDLLEPWRKVEYLPMAFSVSSVDQAAVDRLTLVPK